MTSQSSESKMIVTLDPPEESGQRTEFSQDTNFSYQSDNPIPTPGWEITGHIEVLSTGNAWSIVDGSSLLLQMLFSNVAK